MKHKKHNEVLVFQLADGKVLFLCDMYLLGSRSELWQNLDLLNSHLPFVIEKLFEGLLACGKRDVLLKDVVAKLVSENPCRLSLPEQKYPYMLKELLYAAYCGMNEDELWDGKYNAIDDLCHYDDGRSCYLKSDALKDTLFEECYLSTR